MYDVAKSTMDLLWMIDFAKDLYMYSLQSSTSPSTSSLINSLSPEMGSWIVAQFRALLVVVQWLENYTILRHTLYTLICNLNITICK